MVVPQREEQARIILFNLQTTPKRLTMVLGLFILDNLMTVRPDFITEEQIAAWDEHIKKDEALLDAMPAELVNQPEIKEVLYAGLWVVEELTKMGYDDTIVADIQYAHGRQSFGNDTWQIAKIFIDAYKFSAPKRKTN